MISIGVGSLITYLAVGALLRESWISELERVVGAGNVDAVLFASILIPFMFVFLIPSIVAERYANRYVPACPHCNHELQSSIGAVISTKCCPSCSAQIVAGKRAHTYATYRRAKEIIGRRFLAYWLWVWPIMAIGELIWWCFDPVAALQCRIWVAPLIGTVASGYSWFRTFDRRYTWQFVSSTLLLATLGYVAWRAW